VLAEARKFEKIEHCAFTVETLAHASNTMGENKHFSTHLRRKQSVNIYHVKVLYIWTKNED